MKKGPYKMKGSPHKHGTIEGTSSYIDAMWRRNRDKTPYDNMSKEDFTEYWSKNERKATNPNNKSLDDAYILLQNREIP